MTAVMIARSAVDCCPTCKGSGQHGAMLCNVCDGEGYAPWQIRMTREEALIVFKGEEGE